MSTLTTTDRLKNLLPQLFNEERQAGNYYLRFQLTEQLIGLLDLSYVQESIKIDGEQITPVPNLPGYVVGMMSSRNQVFLALDLAHLIGFPPETVNLRQYQTIVVQINQAKNKPAANEANLYGLTVQKILGISRILPEEFESATDKVPDILQPYIQGAVKDIGGSHNSSIKGISDSLLIDLARLMTTQIES